MIKNASCGVNSDMIAIVASLPRARPITAHFVFASRDSEYDFVAVHTHRKLGARLDPHRNFDFFGDYELTFARHLGGFHGFFLKVRTCKTKRMPPSREN